MNILILGGTVFLGKHIARFALERGHEVSFFNRGISNPELFQDQIHYKGDRIKGDYDSIRGSSWDIVIDPSGYFPRQIKEVADAIDSASLYVYISSVSVYPDLSADAVDEASELISLPDTKTEKITGETYGGLKVLCEKEVQRCFPKNFLNIRPGLIVGPDDPSNRFTYWPMRLNKGGDVLLPGDPARQIQFIDVRDLAAWTVSSAEKGLTGTFNATGPAAALSMSDFIEQSANAISAEYSGTWIPDKFLLDAELGPYVEMPLWIPGFNDTVSIKKALDAGLAFTELETTVRDTLEWAITSTMGKKYSAGLDAAKEKEIIKKYNTSVQFHKDGNNG